MARALATSTTRRWLQDVAARRVLGKIVLTTALGRGETGSR